MVMVRVHHGGQAGQRRQHRPPLRRGCSLAPGWTQILPVPLRPTPPRPAPSLMPIWDREGALGGLPRSEAVWGVGAWSLEPCLPASSTRLLEWRGVAWRRGPVVFYVPAPQPQDVALCVAGRAPGPTAQRCSTRHCSARHCSARHGSASLGSPWFDSPARCRGQQLCVTHKSNYGAPLCLGAPPPLRTEHL